MTVSSVPFPALALAFVIGTVVQPEPDTPRDVLKRALSKQRSVDSVRIESRWTDGRTMWRLKVQTAASKGIKVTVISSLTSSNVVSIDNGKQLETFNPDTNILFVQPSPYLLQPSVSWRMSLIDRNYVPKLGSTTEIAGHEVRELILSPKEEELPVRTMYVDMEHDIVLRYKVEPPERRPTVIFDTKSVWYSRSAALADFELPKAAREATVHRGTAPKKISKMADVSPAVGFTPRNPDRLPYGFKVSGIYLYSREDAPFVGAKLSDGLASLTVYQWRNSPRPVPDIAIEDEDSYGVQYGIAGVPGDPMPKEVMESVLTAFVRASK